MKSIIVFSISILAGATGFCAAAPPLNDDCLTAITDAAMEARQLGKIDEKIDLAIKAVTIDGGYDPGLIDQQLYRDQEAQGHVALKAAFRAEKICKSTK